MARCGLSFDRLRLDSDPVSKMAAAADHVLVQLTIDSVGLARQGFGILIILSHTATFPERVRYYSSTAAGLAEWSADSPEGRALSAAFAQSPKPALVGIARMTGTVTQRFDISLNQVAVGHTYQLPIRGKGVTDTTVSYTALADLDFAPSDVTTASDTIAETAHGMLTGAGPFRVINTGGGLPAGLTVDTNYWIIAVDANSYKLATSKANALSGTAVDLTTQGTGTHTLQRGVNDVIIAQLVDQATAVVGANYTATQITGAGETDTMRMTATAAGRWFAVSSAQPDYIAIAETHAAPTDVTIATDLAAILLADQAWYCIASIYNSDAYIAAVAAWCEANGRVYAAETNNTGCVTTSVGSGTDIGVTLLGLGYTRTLPCYYADPALFMTVAEMGRWLPTDPGKATLKFKTLSGIVGLTFTDQHKINLRARRMNTYEQVLADRPFFWEGTVPSQINKFFDITRNSDWYQDQAQKGILEALTGVEIDPYTTAGIKLLQAALIGVGDLAFRQGVLAAVPVTEAPNIEDVSSNDKGNRNLSGLKQSGTFAGAIHTVKPVNIVLTF